MLLRQYIYIGQMMDDNDTDTIELSDTLKWVYPACKFYFEVSICQHATKQVL